MCDPTGGLLTAGLLLSGGGALVNAREQNNYVNAVNRENNRAVDYARQMKEAERTRQEQYSKEATGLFDKSLADSSVDSYTNQMGASEDSFLDTYDTQKPLLTEGMYLSGQQNANSEIQSEIAKRTANATADARARAANLAKLTGYGVANSAQGVGVQSANDQIRTLQGLRQGSLGVNRLETSVPAADVQFRSNGVGDIMSGIGGLMTMGAGNGATLGSIFAKGGTAAASSSIPTLAGQAASKIGVGATRMPAIMF